MTLAEYKALSVPKKIMPLIYRYLLEKKGFKHRKRNSIAKKYHQKICIIGMFLFCIFKMQRRKVYAEGNIMLALRLPQEVETRLAELAQKTGRSKTLLCKRGDSYLP
jgi:hypothetical protein